MEQGDVVQAIADFNEAIVLNPESHELFFERGQAYAKQRNFQYAIEDYNQALLLSPQNPEVVFKKAVAFGELGPSYRSHRVAQYDAPA